MANVVIMDNGNWNFTKCNFLSNVVVHDNGI